MRAVVLTALVACLIALAGLLSGYSFREGHQATTLQGTVNASDGDPAQATPRAR